MTTLRDLNAFALTTLWLTMAAQPACRIEEEPGADKKDAAADGIADARVPGAPDARAGDGEKPRADPDGIADARVPGAPDARAGDGEKPRADPECSPLQVSQRITVQGSDQVDLLFVINNSPSMAEEQQKLAAVLPAMAKALATGELPIVGGSVRRFSPVASLHVGVVTSDMGVSGVEVSAACHDYGDDGLLRVPTACTPASQGAGNYLGFEAGESNAEALAADVGCLSQTGTAGCRFSQPLEAALKALTPSASNLSFSRQTRGHGDLQNAGFLRPDSILALVVLTDQDDCSAPDSSKEIFELNPTDPKFQRADGHGGFLPEGLNARCALHSEDGTLFPLQRHIDGLKSLRALDPSKLIFAAITGVPLAAETLVTAQGSQDFDAILQRHEMQIRFSDQAALNTLEGASPDQVCASPSSKAVPARRMVQAAKGFGENGIVRSICADDFSSITLAITDRIASRLSGACLTQPLAVSAEHHVSCNLVEVLPPGIERCDAASGRSPTDLPGAQVGQEHVCLVNQVAVDKQAPGCSATDVESCFSSTNGNSTAGWYYDDFSADVQRWCAHALSRVSFTPGAQPRDGSVLTLQCPQTCDKNVACPSGYECRAGTCVAAGCMMDAGVDGSMDGGLAETAEVDGGTSSSSTNCALDQLPDPQPAPGRTPFTQAELVACQRRCGQDQACYTDTNCPGFDAFNACAGLNAAACSASRGGRCRTAYERFACCAETSGCATSDKTCVNTACSVHLSAYDQCLSSDTACLRSALDDCFAAPSG